MQMKKTYHRFGRCKHHRPKLWKEKSVLVFERRRRKQVLLNMLHATKPATDQPVKQWYIRACLTENFASYQAKFRILKCKRFFRIVSTLERAKYTRRARVVEHASVATSGEHLKRVLRVFCVFLIPTLLKLAGGASKLGGTGEMNLGQAYENPSSNVCKSL